MNKKQKKDKALERKKRAAKNVLSSPIPCGKVTSGGITTIGAKERIATETAVIRDYSDALIAADRLHPALPDVKPRRDQLEKSGQIVLPVCVIKKN